jgi:hypothetical protein
MLKSLELFAKKSNNNFNTILHSYKKETLPEGIKAKKKTSYLG